MLNVYADNQSENMNMLQIKPKPPSNAAQNLCCLFPCRFVEIGQALNDVNTHAS